MKTFAIRPLSLACLLAVGAPALAAGPGLDFSGSNIYMKFLDGNQRRISLASGDTASGADQGQWTEFELRIKATVSRQVEAGVRIQSRSPAAYWTDFGFADEDTPVRAKWMKLRGAYILLTPGYAYLDTALLGSSDWGMFDPFTVGKVRYIDRDNYNGFYVKGPVAAGATYELARVSLPNYLQYNWGQGPTCCSTDDTQYQEAVYIGQVKVPVGPARLTASYQWFDDRKLDPNDTNDLDGRGTTTFFRNRVAMLKAEGNVADMVDLRGAFYRSQAKVADTAFGEEWGNSPRRSVSDSAFTLNADVTGLPVPGLTLSAQLFNIGAGYFSNTAARRESDVLLTEGSEAAWYRFGDDLWYGGAAVDYQQSPANNRIVDNAFIDFDEPPNESVVGWKGFTLLGRFEALNTPMSLEVTRIGYDNNWQGYPAGRGIALSNFFPEFQDRRTNIFVFKANHVVPVAGGLDLGFKWKRVADRDRVVAGDPSDDTKVTDNGYAFSIGNQVFSDLYANLSWGRYTRDFAVGPDDGEIRKNITSLKLSYNLAGFELGALAQWIRGSGNLDLEEIDASAKFRQYRMKAFAKVIF